METTRPRAYEDYLSPELLEKARLELGETPEVKEKALREFRELLSEEPDLIPRPDDKFLIRYLRARKYDATKAFKTLRNYYTVKKKYAGQVTDFTPSQLKHILEMGCITILPYREPGGSPVGLVRMDLYDETKASGEEFIATSLLVSEIELEQESTLIGGSVAIIDLKGFTMHKMLQFSSVTLMSLFISCIQDCLACRIKGIHIVNENYFFSIFFKIVKKFLSKKIRDRVFFHGDNLKSLYDHIPQELLPECLGGQVEMTDEFVKSALEKEKYFEFVNQFGFTTNHRL